MDYNVLHPTFDWDSPALTERRAGTFFQHSISLQAGQLWQRQLTPQQRRPVQKKTGTILILCDVKLLARNCRFPPDTVDEMIRDRIVVYGTNSRKVHRSSQSNPTKDVASIRQEEPQVFISLNRTTRQCPRAMFEKLDAVTVDSTNLPTWKNVLREVAINARKEITFLQFVARRWLAATPRHVWILQYKTITFKIDPGAHVNILPKAEFDKLHTRQSLKRSKVTLRGYGGNLFCI